MAPSPRSVFECQRYRSPQQLRHSGLQITPLPGSKPWLAGSPHSPSHRFGYLGSSPYVLFWRALFGLEPEQQWVSPDPYGLIQSKAMISPERSVRLSLNVSESRETALGRSVSSYSGAGVHHVAFTTDDLLGTAEALKRLGAPLLPVP